LRQLARFLRDCIKRFYQWHTPIYKIDGIVRVGSRYGGWLVPECVFNENSVCYLAGAGEDISFDVGLVNKYKCRVFIFDPTPRAKIHFDRLMDAVNSKRNMRINNTSDFYSLSSEDARLMHFSEIDLWNKKEEIKFYSPQNVDFVSHSILNLQQTKSFFIGKVDKLSNFMKVNNHSELTLLKIDIEGAEYAVLESIIEDKLKIKVICVE
jgi:FkbM family methyltransferase